VDTQSLDAEAFGRECLDDTGRILADDEETDINRWDHQVGFSKLMREAVRDWFVIHHSPSLIRNIPRQDE
jgi:hypothetical protein